MQTGILLINLGTPAAPTAKAVRKYLRIFLSDHRVIEIPRLVWLPILYAFVLPFRALSSAKKYQSIWTTDGSPLMYNTRAQQEALEQALQSQGLENTRVTYAMRYGTPSIHTGLTSLINQGCQRIIALPLYPQYAASSTASALDIVFQHLQTMRNIPELCTINSFHTDKGYIQALAKQIRQHRQQHHTEHLLMSFHGLPQAMIEKGDPYFEQCQQTAKLLALELGLASNAYSVSFQSRFGKAKWISPSTNDTLALLASNGIKNLHIVCPGFVSDCLETLEEIAMEGEEVFLSHGGEQYHYIPCLNTEPDWINTLVNLCKPYLTSHLKITDNMEVTG